MAATVGVVGALQSASGSALANRTVTIAPTAGSVVVMALLDWDATAGTKTGTPSPPAPVERQDMVDTGAYGVWVADWTSVVGGSQAFGIAAGTVKATKIAVEVRNGTLAVIQPVPYTTATDTAQFPSVGWDVGDLLIVIVGVEDSNGGAMTTDTPTAPGLTFTEIAVLNASSQCHAHAWQASPASTGVAQITVGRASGAQHWGATLWAFTSAGGPSNYTETNSEALGITDSRTWTSATVADPVIDPVAITDSRAQVFASVQAYTEAVGLLDAIVQVYTPGGGGIPDFTDHIGILDIFNAVVAGARTNGELLGLLDTANRVTTNPRIFTDPTGITDSVSAQLNQPVTYTEFRLFDSNPAPTSEQTDTPANVGLRFYTLQSNVYVTGFWWYRPTGSPAAVPVRLFDQAGAIIVSFIGSAPLEGAWNRLNPTSTPIILIPGQHWTVSVHTSAYGFFDGQFETNQFDPPLLADGGAAFVDNEVLIHTADPDVLPPAGTGAGDGYGVDVVVGLPVIAPQTVTDPVGIADPMLVFNGQQEAAADVAGLVDAEAHVANYVRFIDDINGAPQTVTNPVGLTDSRTINAGTTRQPVEAENILDSIARLLASPRTFTNPVGITDSVTGLLNSTGLDVTIGDTVGALDSQSKINAQFLSIVDHLGIDDDLPGQAGSGIFYFTPPVYLVRPLAFSVPGIADEPFIHFAEGGVGINVWKLNDGSYTQVQPFDMTTVAHEYLGGHVHPVDAAEAAALTAAGYGSNLS